VLAYFPFIFSKWISARLTQIELKNKTKRRHT